jgi:hypothetical protein
MYTCTCLIGMLNGAEQWCPVIKRWMHFRGPCLVYCSLVHEIAIILLNIHLSIYGQTIPSCMNTTQYSIIMSCNAAMIVMLYIMSIYIYYIQH